MNKSSVKIYNYLPNNGDKRTEKNILSGLSGSSKMISCKFFYDPVGSKLFKDITRLPEYYLTRTEIPLIKKAATELGNKLRNIDIVEFGSGDCRKISILLNKIPQKYRNSICYIPFDVSLEAVKNSSNILLSKFPEIKIYGIVADFLSQLHVIPINSKKLFCFLGSTIGNLSIPKAQLFLKNLYDIMKSGDMLLLGFDMVKNKEVLERAYNDSQNVTEKFNKNILIVVNDQINSDFNPDNFKHIAFFNKDLSRIEMHLKAMKDLKINCPGSSFKIFVKKGETIHTENSHKFTEKNIKNLSKSANLKIQKIYSDSNKWFSLLHLIKD